MNDVSALRLYGLRAGYLLLVVGLGFVIWPELLHHEAAWPLMRGVVVSMLAAMSVLAVLGLFRPLEMLPLLFFELTWKTIWLLSVVLPAWSSHRMTPGIIETAFECIIAVVFLGVIPWRFVFDTYVNRASALDEKLREGGSQAQRLGRPIFVCTLSKVDAI